MKGESKTAFRWHANAAAGVEPIVIITVGICYADGQCLVKNVLLPLKYVASALMFTLAVQRILLNTSVLLSPCRSGSFG